LLKTPQGSNIDSSYCIQQAEMDAKVFMSKNLGMLLPSSHSQMWKSIWDFRWLQIKLWLGLAT